MNCTDQCSRFAIALKRRRWQSTIKIHCFTRNISENIYGNEMCSRSTRAASERRQLNKSQEYNYKKLASMTQYEDLLLNDKVYLY